ncbi:MAG: pyrroloquinoline quinone-dependent dehydrogenase [Sphingobacteriales bacterium 40-81]|nr:MAG: pyrroloquinoline quinone-dependent dehydrogenase [Sphingobacteriales bacterium 40-81]
MYNMRLCYVIIAGLVYMNAASAQSAGAAGKEWHNYGNDAGGKRFSPVKQINDANVKKLKPAWVFHTGELQTYEGTKVIEKAAFEATPLMIDGTLYFSTATCRVFAIDAGTGKEKWMYNPGVNLKADYSEITSRGVSAWTSGAKADKKETRIFTATIDGRLIALNAANGKPVYAFGNEGTVNLREGFGSEWSVTSPPAIIGNTIVVGSSMGDNQKIDYPKGTVRAYDVLSGALKWSWDPVPKDSTDKAWQTWKNNSATITGAANAWSVIAADAERDMVFIPTSSPSPDYYGGERQGQNLYGNSIVALKASTGKMLWYYQVVHHDLWDYDIAAQPVLLDIEKGGKKIPAVAVGTKMGHIFILDRETGKPLFPVEERLVPASDIAGEEAWKTQPFPVLPAPVGLQHITEADAWGITPEGKTEAAKRIAQYRNEGNFTPPGFKGTIVTPGNVGGIHWGGMTYDEKNRLLITNINRLAAVIRLIPREQLRELEKTDSTLLRAETGRQRGTPYVMKRDYLFKATNTGMVMQTRPPWGTILAIDLRTGEKKWEVPLGYMMDPSKYPGAENWGSLNFGGAVTTAGNLTFVAATFDNHLRAFNTQTGRLLWQAELPASAQATPMTYEWKGKQYIVIAAGGHGKLGTKQGDSVVAFALE